MSIRLPSLDNAPQIEVPLPKTDTLSDILDTRPTFPVTGYLEELRDLQLSVSDDREAFIGKRIGQYTHTRVIGQPIGSKTVADLTDGVDVKLALSNLETRLNFLKYGGNFEEPEFIEKEVADGLAGTGVSVKEAVEKYRTRDWKELRSKIESGLGKHYNVCAIRESAVQDYENLRDYQNSSATGEIDIDNSPQAQLERFVEELDDVMPDKFGRKQIDEKSIYDPNIGKIVTDDVEASVRNLKWKGYTELARFIIPKTSYVSNKGDLYSIRGINFTHADLGRLAEMLKNDEPLDGTLRAIAKAVTPFVDRHLDPYSRKEMLIAIDKNLRVGSSDGVQANVVQDANGHKTLRKLGIALGVGVVGGLYLLSGLSHGISPSHLQSPTVKLLNPMQASDSASTYLDTNTLHPVDAFKTYIGADPGVIGEFQGTSSSPMKATGWLSLYNNAGQTLGVYEASATIGPNATGQIDIPTLKVPDGSYSGSLFTTTPNGIVISPTIPVTVVYNHLLDAPVITLAKTNSTLVANLTDQVNRDSSVSVSQKIPVILYAADLLNNLNISGFKQLGSIRTLGNYSLAVVQSKLPEIPLPTISKYLQATEIEPALSDFTPVVVVDSHGNSITAYKSANISRDTWMMAQLGTQRNIFDTIKDQGEWKRVFLNEEANNLLDNPYGPGYFDKTTYKPTDPVVWQAITSAYDFFNSQPAKMQSDGLPVSFHYNNETQLKQDISSRTDRIMAEKFLFEIPASAIDPSTNKVVSGMAAMLLQPQVIWPHDYNTLKTLYTQAKIDDSALYSQLPSSDYYLDFNSYKSIIKVVSGNPSNDFFLANWAYWQWEGDRYIHGLKNTVNQYIQIDKDFTQSVNGWDLRKLAVGNGRAQTINPTPDYLEGNVYLIPNNLKSILAPSIVGGDFRHYIGTVGGTAYGFELIHLGIPDKVLSPLKSGAYGQVTTVFGNGVGLLPCTGGLQADLAAGAQHVNVEPYLAYASVYEILGYNPTVWPDQFPGTKIPLWPKTQ